MSQRLSHLEERQREMHTSMGFETPEQVVYPTLPPLVVEDPWLGTATPKKMTMTR
jgi:hypothetical protein